MTQPSSRSATGFLQRVCIAGICAPFIVSGIVKGGNLEAASREIVALGIVRAGETWPGLIAALVVAVQLGGALLAIFCRGLPGAMGALALAAFTALATWLAHAFWAMEGAQRAAELNTFMEHVALVSALLMVAWVNGRSAVGTATSSAMRQE